MGVVDGRESAHVNGVARRVRGGQAGGRGRRRERGAIQTERAGEVVVVWGVAVRGVGRSGMRRARGRRDAAVV